MFRYCEVEPCLIYPYEITIVNISTLLKNIDIDIDKDYLENIDIDKDYLETIDIDILSILIYYRY